MPFWAAFAIAWMSAAVIGPDCARAQSPEPVALSWDVPAQCPDAPFVRARVRAQLPSGFEPEQRWTAEGRIVADGGRLRLELTLQSGEFEAHKTLRSASCEALADAAALLIAMALNPSAGPGQDAGTGTALSAVDQETAPPQSEARQPESAASADSRAQRAPSQPARAGAGPPDANTARHAEPVRPREEPPPSAWPEIELGVGAEAGLQTGMLPQTPAPGLRAQLLLGIGRLRTAAAISLWPSTRAAVENYSRGHLDAHGWLAAIEVGWRLLPARLQLGPTAVLERGELSVESTGVSAPASGGASWTAAGLGVYGAYTVAGGFAFTAEALAITPFARPRWLLRTPGGDAAVFTADAVGLRIYAGMAYVFE